MIESMMKSNPLYDIVTGLYLDNRDLLDMLSPDLCYHQSLRELGDRIPNLAPFISQILLARKDARADLSHWELRGICNKIFSYGIPHPEALDRIAELTDSVIEMGAGTGYWSYLLSERGVKVRAFDNGSWKLPSLYYKVARGGIPKVKDAAEDTLLLCWPPCDTRMAYDCLRNFEGSRVVYVGEGSYGCTGCSKFHDLLDEEWKSMGCLPSVSWPGMHDQVRVYQR